MSFDEGLFYFYLIASGLLGIHGTIRGIRILFGWVPKFADHPQSLKWLILVRSLLELAFLYCAYQLFTRQLLDVLPILLIGVVFTLVLLGGSLLIGNHILKKNADPEYPL